MGNDLSALRSAFLAALGVTLTSIGEAMRPRDFLGAGFFIALERALPHLSGSNCDASRLHYWTLVEDGPAIMRDNELFTSGTFVPEISNFPQGSG